MCSDSDFIVLIPSRFFLYFKKKFYCCVFSGFFVLPFGVIKKYDNNKSVSASTSCKKQNSACTSDKGVPTARGELNHFKTTPRCSDGPPIRIRGILPT